jgi:arabinose-5-phosphate isomerase
MKTEGLPFLAPGASNLDLIALMAEARYGFVIIANNGKILGIVTDGDLRRGLNKYGEKFLQMSVEVIMTKDPITIDKEKKIQEAERIMRRKKISCLIVEEGGECLGIVMLRDMMF